MVSATMRSSRTSRSGSRNSSLAWIAAVGLIVAGAGCKKKTQSEAPPASETPAEPDEPAKDGADLVFVRGVIKTMDPDKPRASSVAVKDGRIVAVGGTAATSSLVGDNTRVIDLKGRMLTPGLVDAHAHVTNLGLALETVQLRGIESEAKVAAAIAEAAKTLPEGEWVIGRGWDQTLWESQEFPTRKSVDEVVDDRPVAVTRVDGHALLANSKALELAGIDKDTKDPPGGKIVRDGAGAATGVLVDTAMKLVTDKIPAPSTEVIERRVRLAAKEIARQGITAVHDMGVGDAEAAVLARLAMTKELPIRVIGFLSYQGPETTESLRTREQIRDLDGTARFTLRSVKAYADGALGSRGAALLEPYADDKGNTGLLVNSPQDLDELAVMAALTGWQVGVHAIGDRGNRIVLDAFEKARKSKPDADLRFRVEHAQVVALEDIPRFAELGVIASMQPTHASSDWDWVDARIGPERAKGAYAWRRFLDAGVRIAAGSDFPVEKVSPLLGLHAAVNRTGEDGEPPGGWQPDQKLTLDEALEIFTVEPAYASFVESFRGALKPGYIADLVVFDRELKASNLLEAAVDMTVVGGDIVFEK